MVEKENRDLYVVCKACGRYVRRGKMAEHIERECRGHVRCATVGGKKDD